jgi:hypothetical protein
VPPSGRGSCNSTLVFHSARRSDYVEMVLAGPIGIERAEHVR